MIRAAAHPAAAARQHRPARRRHPGAARPRHHPGHHRHPDALRPAARLPAAAARLPSRTRRSTSYVEHETTPTGYWANFPKYIVSLLKAWYGDAATAENDYGFDWLPKIDGDHSQLPMTARHARTGRSRACSASARTPPSAASNAEADRRPAWPSSTGWWCATGSRPRRAAFWNDAPEVATASSQPEDIKTEVFLLPAASPAEKDGTLHQHPAAAAVARQGGRPARATAAPTPGSSTTSGKRLKQLYADSDRPERDQPIRHLTWDYSRPTGAAARALDAKRC